MKKLASIFLAAALATSLLAVSTGAADGEIKKVAAADKPAIDGVLDAVYTDSFCLTDLGTADNAYGTDWWYTATADVYFLYDDQYLYICAEVEDDDVLTKGEAFATGDNPYANDNIEFRLSMDGNETETIKVAVDAYGYACFGLAAHYAKLDYSAIQYATTYTDTNYCVEVAIPCTQGQLNMLAQGKLGFTYQLNDINADGKHVNHTTSFEGEAVKMPIFYALSEEYAKAPAAEAPETTAPETTAPVVVETTAPVVAETTAPVAAETTAPVAAETDAPVAAETDAPVAAETTAPVAAETTAAPVTPVTPKPANPGTFDVLTVAGVIAAASGAAFVLASKKH